MDRPLPRRAAGAARLAVAVALSMSPGCTCTDLGPEPKLQPITSAFRDDFDRAAIGPDWRATDESAYSIVNGELVARNAYNHPLWLARPIPRDATIEFDCWSNDDAGDLKVEVWGDGHSFSTDRVGAYTSTAYNFIFGGWHNQISTLARMHEHGEDRQVRRDVRAEKGRRYHFAITRKGAHIEWRIDGAPFLSFDDPQPLEGPQHAYFGINDWEAELHFDHLTITPSP
jgi:hypothetical protein